MMFLLLLQVSWFGYLVFKQRKWPALALAVFWIISWLPLFNGLAFSQLWLGHFQAPSLIAMALPWFSRKVPTKLTLVLLGGLVFAGILGVHWLPVYEISHGEPAIGLMLGTAIVAIICQRWLITALAVISMFLIVDGIALTALWLDVWLWLWCLLTLPVDLAKHYWGKLKSKPA